MELRDFMLKFYENLIYGMLRSSLTTDDRVSNSYFNLGEKEKRDLEVELHKRAKNMSLTVVNELIAHNLLLETKPTNAQAIEIEKIIRKVLLDYSEN
jgi:hypothetical protein